MFLCFSLQWLPAIDTKYKHLNTARRPHNMASATSLVLLSNPPSCNLGTYNACGSPQAHTVIYLSPPDIAQALGFAWNEYSLSHSLCLFQIGVNLISHILFRVHLLQGVFPDCHSPESGALEWDIPASSSGSLTGRSCRNFLSPSVLNSWCVKLECCQRMFWEVMCRGSLEWCLSLGSPQ